MTQMLHNSPDLSKRPEQGPRPAFATAGLIAEPVEDIADRYLHDAGGAAVVVWRNLQVVQTNAAGRSFFGATVGQFLNLHWVSPVSVSRVRQFLSVDGAGCLPVRLNQLDQGPRLALATVLAAHHNRRGLIGIRRLSLVWRAGTNDILRDAFDLTSAEADICRLIFSSCNPDEIARLRDASLKTVRTQLSMIFQKTETSGQVELALLLAQIAGLDQGKD